MLLVAVFLVVCACLSDAVPIDLMQKFVLDSTELVEEVSNLENLTLLVGELPKPYEFGFHMNDGNGSMQHRQEIGDESGAVVGSYGYVDPFGVYRNVTYRADERGYRAVVHSNEPGIAGQETADVIFVVGPPPPSSIPLELAINTLAGDDNATDYLDQSVLND